MNNFKLLAIIPLRGCDLKFRKNLKIGKKYRLYQDYKITLNKLGEITNVIGPNHNDDLHLYSKPNEIQVSISAIVGENGSGKSSLIELFYYATYFIGTKARKKNDIDETIIDPAEVRIGYELSEIEAFVTNWKNNTLGEDKDMLLSRIIKRYKIDISQKATKKTLQKFIEEKLNEQKIYIERRIKLAEELDEKINSSLNVAIIFESDKIYCIEIIKGKFSLSNFLDGNKNTLRSISEFNLEEFFYSISVNYSHHSLNANSLGEWIDSLFHKNDGYQTPVVINPMRTEGNFDVNQENNLLKERLIGNVTYNLYKNNQYKFLDKYIIEEFIFSLKLITGGEIVGRRPYHYPKDFFKIDPIGQILYCQGISSFKNDEITEKAIAYLDKKVFRIPEQYPFLFKTKITRKNFKELVDFINTDSSHITKKIYQTVFFLGSYGKTQELENMWKPNKSGSIVITKTKMITWLNSFSETINNLQKEGENLSSYNFSNFSLPGFMNIDFKIKDTEKGGTFKLSELSSGEQQIILNLSSISYHLNNIQSIHGGKVDRFQYSYVNIILDEIELYHHPNKQRSMINDLLNSIKELPLQKKGIQAINIIFSTHSPFILSDIPSNNILRLKDGRPEPSKGQTFGANIHNLLTDKFFMTSEMGQFAESKINEMIDKIKSKNQMDEQEKKLLFKQINLIGEPLLKNSLLEMWRIKFSKPSYTELLQLWEQSQN